MDWLWDVVEKCGSRFQSEHLNVSLASLAEITLGTSGKFSDCRRVCEYNSIGGANGWVPNAIQCHLIAKYLHLISGMFHTLVATTELPNMW